MSVKKWIEEVREHAEPEIVIMLVGRQHLNRCTGCYHLLGHKFAKWIMGEKLGKHLQGLIKIILTAMEDSYYCEEL